MLRRTAIIWASHALRISASGRLKRDATGSIIEEHMKGGMGSELEVRSRMGNPWLMIGHAVRQKVEGVLVRSHACGRRGCKYQYSGPFGRIHHSGTRGKY